MFVLVVCSIQYRVVKQNADDAFYELQNPKEQIQSYVFDGTSFSTKTMNNITTQKSMLVNDQSYNRHTT